MKKSDEKRQLILDTAYRLFCSKGYDGTSMSEVTAEVGGSKATIYNYFPSKEELFVECMFGVAENYLDGVFAPLLNPKASLPGALNKFGENVLRLLCDPEILASRRLTIAEGGRSGIGKMLYGKLLAKQAELATILTTFMDAGQLRNADPDLAAAQLRALLEAEVFEPLLLQALDTPPNDRALKKAAARAVDTFLRAYAPESGAAQG
jgi:AcrR family transcriptional regulator